SAGASWPVSPWRNPHAHSASTHSRTPRSYSEHAVIDQPCRADMRGERHDDGTIRALDLGELDGVAHLAIVDADERIGLERRARRGRERGGRALARAIGGFGGGQAARQPERG